MTSPIEKMMTMKDAVENEFFYPGMRPSEKGKVFDLLFYFVFFFYLTTNDFSRKEVLRCVLVV